MTKDSRGGVAESAVALDDEDEDDNDDEGTLFRMTHSNQKSEAVISHFKFSSCLIVPRSG